ncbi:AraC family transcriptional regulator [bacterium C-53]|nr:AraC family transcriptional regulator [Lachnospiraceae bacterium]NBI03950.1 AraC family transcriptional regulator [Lachnospiraceae bacterium]RKJ08892.1 AraC family transcriptional regulator [bacterium C-53]
MYINSGYLNNSLIDFKDKSKPLVVGSCGTYRLNTHPKLPTYRPRGRIDYQLLYVSSGTAHFHFDDINNEMIVTAGNMVLYRPKELQKYEYYGADKAEVYWIHFTGNNVKNILRSYGITDDMRVFYVGASLEFERIFKRAISELQRCQPDYEEVLVLLLRQLLVAIHRRVLKKEKTENEYLDVEMDIAAQYFNDNYNTDICIEDYAASKGMSVSWFIRNFKQYTGETPMQYIVSIRITNAQMLLETTSYTVSEIGRIVGYENPLYFSRLFRKQKGVSPSEHRKNIFKTMEPPLP